MSVQVQWRRGSAAQNDAFVGAVGEITVDTENNQLRIHDGATAGGTPTVSLAGTETLENKTLVSATLTGTATGAGNISLTGNITGANLNTGAQVVATGNITGGNLVTGGLVLATGNVTGGNLTTAGTVTTVTFTASSTAVVTGNITGGNLITAGLVSTTSITKTGSNGVGNIGSSTSYFNTVFAKATSAQYADVAERYIADAEYAPGTVVAFGGNHEVTSSQGSHTTTIAGVVSTAPALIMNNGLEGENVVTVALLGRVPCRVVGDITKGSCLVASDIPGVATILDPDQYRPGCVIGKALESHSGDTVGEIEVAVGKL